MTDMEPEKFSVVFLNTVPRVTSREQGRAARSLLKNLVRLHGTIELSLGGIEAMTPSFADECFGRLLEELGEAEFRRAVRFRGADPTTKTLINQVLRIRLGEMKNKG